MEQYTLPKCKVASLILALLEVLEGLLRIALIWPHIYSILHRPHFLHVALNFHVSCHGVGEEAAPPNPL